MTQNQFTGILSSVENPGTLSLMFKGITAFIISLATLWASVHGLDAGKVTSAVQSLIDQSFTTVSAVATAISFLIALFGAARKAWYALFAKPVVTVPTAVATPSFIAPSA